MSSEIWNWAINKISDEVLRRVLLCLNAGDIFEKFERTLLRADAIVGNLCRLQHNDNNMALRKCLQDLRKVAYDSDDILDELYMYSKNGKTDPSTDFPAYIKQIPERMDTSAGKLEAIIAEVEKFGINEMLLGKVNLQPPAISQRPETSSIEFEPNILGREKERNVVLASLLNDHQPSPTIISLVGMAGIGKTTLARLVYNEPRVCSHFSKRIWVSVRPHLDLLKVTRCMVESCTLKATELTNLNALQVTLQNLLVNKKFLLILDDVWDEGYENLHILLAPLRGGAKGSKVLVTSRSHSVSHLFITSPSRPFHLPLLSEQDSWLLFKLTAFGTTDIIIPPCLIKIGRRIVAKCQGSPLAIKAHASVLRSTTQEDDWTAILMRKLQDFPEEQSQLLPSLMLSFHYLPSHLKQCFVHCIVFPKRVEIEKQDLVRLWMAEGFVQPKGRKSKEEVGSDIIDGLLERSLFQIVHQVGGGPPRFTMHDLIHDLAELVSCGEYLLSDGQVHGPSIKKCVRYVSIWNPSALKTDLATLRLPPGLRTLLTLGENKTGITKISPELFSQVLCLRVLHLSKTLITELPPSILLLTHLRYLDLSFTLIAALPKNMKDLLSLETLKLRGCKKLSSFPVGISLPSKLKVFELPEDASSIPGLGKLTALESLTGFVVMATKKKRCTTDELNSLTLLTHLEIVKLEQIKYPEQTSAYLLDDKIQIRCLELKWTETEMPHVRSYVSRSVLECLKPNKKLEELTISFYPGTSFSSWMNFPSLFNLVTLSIRNCRNCNRLPWLGRLTALKHLEISDMGEIEKIDAKFCSGTGSPTKAGFPALESVVLHKLNGLTSWEITQGDAQHIRSLHVLDCPNLSSLPLSAFSTSLRHLNIIGCPQIERLPDVTMSLQSLNVEKSPGFVKLYKREGINILGHTQVRIDGVLQI